MQPFSLSFLMLISMDNTILLKCWHRIVQCRACQFHWTVRNEYRSKEKKNHLLIIGRMRGLLFMYAWRERIYTVIDSLRPEIKVNFHLHITPKLSASMGTSFSENIVFLSLFISTPLKFHSFCLIFAFFNFLFCFAKNLL